MAEYRHYSPNINYDAYAFIHVTVLLATPQKQNLNFDILKFILDIVYTESYF